MNLKKCYTCTEDDADDGLCSSYIDGDKRYRCADRWTKKKLTLLKHYMDIFTTGMHYKWENRLGYIDLFCGPGRNIIKKDKATDGSPLLSLKTDHSFSEYYFNDINPISITSLKAWIQEVPDINNKNIKFYSEDYKSAVRKIMHELDDYKLYFAFVDPTNIDFDYECLKLLSNNKRIDLMILFALGMSMQRNIDKWFDSNDETKIDIFLGGNDWRDDFRKHGNSITKWKSLYDYYCKKVMELGYLEPDSVSDTFGVKNSKNRNIYYLTFFSKNIKGYEFFRKIKKYSTSQTSLF